MAPAALPLLAGIRGSMQIDIVEIGYTETSITTRIEKDAKGEIVTRDIQMVAEKALGGVGPDGQPFQADLINDIIAASDISLDGKDPERVELDVKPFDPTDAVEFCIGP